MLQYKEVNRPKTKNYITKIIDTFRILPRRYYVLGALFLLTVLIAAVFWPRSVTLTYASPKTCFYQPTIAPGLLRTSGGEGYRLEADQVVAVGSVPLFAAKMCVVPLKAPTEGEASVRLSLLGSVISKTYTVKASKVPHVAQSIPEGSVALSKPLMVTLSEVDRLHEYKLSVDNVQAPCAVDELKLRCDIKALGLQQGKDYIVAIERHYAGKQAGTLAKKSIHTLEATAIVGTSIQPGETVFAKPLSLELATDKPVAGAEFQLYKVNGNAREKIPVQTSHENTKIIVSWQGELDRRVSYELEAVSLSGRDGSGLDGGYKLGFSMSGGPKVTNVSVGTYKVAMGATATITFDQPIAEAQDVSQAITVSGGGRVVTGKGNQVTISLAGAPRCGTVTMKVSDILKSSYDVSGGSVWSYTTRMICQTIGSIGTSVKGRSITTYSFGSGPNTVVYTGAIHGSESSTRALMLRWIDDLEVNPSAIPADKTVVVIPAINPDGLASGTRTNANNVDLNRNFATRDWVSDITTTANTPFPGGGGKTALSEPESQAIANYIGRVRPTLVLSYHSIGALLAANQAGNSSARAANYASLSGYRNTTGSSDAFEYGISGTADDYYAERYGVPSILVELGSHSDAQFSRNQKAMWAMLR